MWVAALTLSLTLGLLIIGLPIVLGAAYAMRWTAELDRQNAALVFGRPVRGHYRSHRATGLFARVFKTLRDPQVWRDFAWLITHSIVGFAFGVIAVSLVVSDAQRGRAARSGPGRCRTATTWGSGTWTRSSRPSLAAWLALPLGFVTVWVLRGLAKFHASLAVELLGRH